ALSLANDYILARRSDLVNRAKLARLDRRAPESQVLCSPPLPLGSDGHASFAKFLKGIRECSVTRSVLGSFGTEKELFPMAKPTAEQSSRRRELVSQTSAGPGGIYPAETTAKFLAMSKSYLLQL